MSGLRNFTEEDIPILQKYMYENAADQEMQELVTALNQKEYKGRYYEAFAISDGEKLVGFVSLYQHTESMVSCGIEVFRDFQRRYYAFYAMAEALEIAKSKGYRIVLDQVRTNNAASIALHKKLGFETDVYEYQNKRGNGVFLFFKLL